ncbi:isoprenoid synthase domain-containing protein [Lyophyllum atratum]|nr:isoprenoid synthase domain-containing protein [Lyophyllum atratum]
MAAKIDEFNLNGVLADDSHYNGVLPSKATGKASNMEHGEQILNIAANFIRGLDYSPPDFPRDPTLRKAVLDELDSWNIGAASDGFLKCADVGTAAAELFYPAHEFDLKIVIAICTAGMKWMDNVADDILEPLTAFQGRFHARKPQLHPVLDCYAHFMLRLYDHYEPYVADAMVMSSVTFIAGSCLEVRSLSKGIPQSTDAKLWPYYVRNLSGISGFYAYACFPKKDHPDVVDYVQAIPEILVFTNFLNDVLSFYKEEMDGEQHNYCQMMGRVTGEAPIKILQDVSDETVAVAKRAALILKNAPAARRAFKEYEQGYIRFHLDVAHYRLPIDLKREIGNPIIDLSENQALPDNISWSELSKTISGPGSASPSESAEVPDHTPTSTREPTAALARPPSPQEQALIFSAAIMEAIQPHIQTHLPKIIGLTFPVILYLITMRAFLFLLTILTHF